MKYGLANGESIAGIELKLKDLPQFNRKRARMTAQTEILAACSRSQWEAYNQSPAVVKKKWKHFTKVCSKGDEINRVMYE